MEVNRHPVRSASEVAQGLSGVASGQDALVVVCGVTSPYHSLTGVLSVIVYNNHLRIARQPTRMGR